MQYPSGRIAQIVEREAGKKFGPEKLTKELVAQALNIPPEQLTEGEWEEISEFAVNAGAALIRSSLSKDKATALTEEGLESIREKVKEIRDGLIPYHDIFHAAETYRLSKGVNATAEFAEQDLRSRYTDSNTAAAELYPVLFLIIPPQLNEPLPVLLSHTEGRALIAEFLSTSFDTSLPDVQTMIQTLETANQSEDPSVRKKEYERLVEVIVISNAIKRLQDTEPAQEELTKAEMTAIHEAIQRAAQDPGSHYHRFADKVFSTTNWGNEPRLFVDEFLSCIRQEGNDIALAEPNP